MQKFITCIWMYMSRAYQKSIWWSLFSASMLQLHCWCKRPSPSPLSINLVSTPFTFLKCKDVTIQNPKVLVQVGLSMHTRSPPYSHKAGPSSTIKREWFWNQRDLSLGIFGLDPLIRQPCGVDCRTALLAFRQCAAPTAECNHMVKPPSTPNHLVHLGSQKLPARLFQMWWRCA